MRSCGFPQFPTKKRLTFWGSLFVLLGKAVPPKRFKSVTYWAKWKSTPVEQAPRRATKLSAPPAASQCRPRDIPRGSRSRRGPTAELEATLRTSTKKNGNGNRLRQKNSNKKKSNNHKELQATKYKEKKQEQEQQLHTTTTYK